MEPGKILFVINSGSGADNSNDPAEYIKRISGESNLEHEIFLLTGGDNRSGISSRIDSFRPDTVVAGGGDGTVNLIASIIAGKDLNMGILPLGSANGLAVELGIPPDPEEALEFLIRGTAKPVDLVRINNEHVSIHLSDLGINARIVREFEKEDKRGFRIYVKHFFKELFQKPRTFVASISTDDERAVHKALMIIIANASNYRTGANINPQGTLDDGKFEVVVIKPGKAWRWHGFTGAFTGTFHRKPNVEVYSCSKAFITVDPHQDFQIDGEPLGKLEHVNAVIEKHALNLIY